LSVNNYDFFLSVSNVLLGMADSKTFQQFTNKLNRTKFMCAYTVKQIRYNNNNNHRFTAIILVNLH